ncbi:hypothetical protein [Streptomyces phytophilus]|uniref:hypothetical protein n=1 Tax=Streptomyces phytophilus TaxID=722715 RepID=UPI0015F0076C|nr:hypothetical protein [Streptomyces phytophilus]
MEDATTRLAEAWEVFDLALRMREGLNEESLANLRQALEDCERDWRSKDQIPRLAVNILVDIFPATEGNAALYDRAEQERVMRVAFDLQDLVGRCVGL